MTTTLQFGPITLDVKQGQVSGPRGYVQLQPHAFAVLERLFRRPGIVAEHQDLQLDIIREGGDVHVRRVVSSLRHLLDALGGGSVQIRADANDGYYVASQRSGTAQPIREAA